MPLTKEDLLDIWRNSFDSSYTIPLEEEADGRGFDVIAAQAAIFARVAAANETTTQAMYLFEHSIQVGPPAAGEARATGQVSISREAPTNGDLNLKIGDPIDVFLLSPNGESFFEIGLELLEDVLLPTGVKGPFQAQVQARRPGYQANISDTQARSAAFQERLLLLVQNGSTTTSNVITAGPGGDQLDEGTVDAFVVFTAGLNRPTGPRRILSYDPVADSITVDGTALIASSQTESFSIVGLQDLGVTVELDGPLTGGRHGWLDQLGTDKNIGRIPGESDDDYRKRIGAIPDTVSLNALIRACNRVLLPAGVNFRVMESRNRDDFTGDFTVGSDQSAPAWDVLPYDDPNTDFFPQNDAQHFWQGDQFEYSGFYIMVERTTIDDPGWPFDQWPTPQGVANAWDLMGYDGFDVGFANLLVGLVLEIEKTRMAGVPWLLVLVDLIP